MNTRTEIPGIDPVAEVLQHLRMSGAFYCRSELSSPFGIDLPAMPSTLMFHIMISGRCWLQVADNEAQCLQPGDLALVPHGLGHVLLSDPGTRSVPLFDLPRELVSDRYELLKHGGGGSPAIMLCGAVKFDHPSSTQLLHLLPSLILVDAWSDSESQWIQSTLRLITEEATQLRIGGETIITRLCDVLVIQAIRSWLSRVPDSQPGWLGAMRDKQIGRAMLVIHRSPEQQWTVPILAKECSMSRSAFAARFKQLVGESAMKYVTRWRMQVARNWLNESSVTLAVIATRLGYSSEAAFSRAFKRFMGVSPGQTRKNPESL